MIVLREHALIRNWRSSEPVLKVIDRHAGQLVNPGQHQV